MSFAHLNPAVTIGMAIAGKIGWDMVVPYILGQMIGAIIGAVLVYIHYYPHWKETKDQATILGVFATGPAIRSLGANLISEIIGTFMLVFALLAFGMSKFGDGLNPIAVGILILVIGLSLGGTTGYAINPARDLGPRIAHAFLPIPNKGGSDWGYALVPIAGPIIGGILAALLFMILPM
jgi:glycerol uptake facilitator protein